MKVSLVIPAYNESAIIAQTIETALDALSGAFDGFELIAVNDGSADDTGDILKGYEQRGVTALGYTPNRGKGRAVRTGMLASTGDLVFFTDADLAYGLEVITAGARLLADTGADVIAGSRKLQKGGYGGYSAVRLAASQCFSFVTRLMSGMEYDTQCGIKGFTRAAAHDIFSQCETDGFAFDFEVMLLARRGGYKIEQMPVKIINHRDSRVNVARDSINMLRQIRAVTRKKRGTEYEA